MPRSKAIQYFNEHAEELAVFYNSLDRGVVHAELIKCLPHGALRMLDVGAGSGADAAFFADKGHHVTAAEPARVLRALANKSFKGKNIKWSAARLPALPRVGRDFDVVYSVGTLQYLDAPERQAALARMAGLLKEGGLLEIQYPNPPTRAHQHLVGDGEIGAFVQAFNQAGGARLEVVYQETTPDIAGRKTPDGSDVRFHTAIIRRSA